MINIKALCFHCNFLFRLWGSKLIFYYFHVPFITKVSLMFAIHMSPLCYGKECNGKSWKDHSYIQTPLSSALGPMLCKASLLILWKQISWCTTETYCFSKFDEEAWRCTILVSSPVVVVVLLYGHTSKPDSHSVSQPLNSHEPLFQTNTSVQDEQVSRKPASLETRPFFLCHTMVPISQKSLLRKPPIPFPVVYIYSKSVPWWA